MDSFMSNKIMGQSCNCGNNLNYQQVNNKKIKILLEPGHGGEDTGDKFDDKYEKDVNLEFVYKVGEFLSNHSYDVEYTRESDVFMTDEEKKDMANGSGADLYVALHRTSNISSTAIPGVEVIIFEPSDFEMEVANNITRNLEHIGFMNLGVLSVQGSSAQYADYEVPQVTVLIGMYRNGRNYDYDTKIDEIAEATADGIMETFKLQAQNYIINYHYKIQVGIFRTFDEALTLQSILIMSGYQTDIVKDGDYYTIHCGDFDDLDKAVQLEYRLKYAKYNTVILTK